MPNKKGRGDSESPWLVARRCLAVINRLQQGAATKQELITAVYQTNDALEDQKTLANRFEKDKKRLQDGLNISILYDKTVKGYIIGERERPLHYRLHALWEN